MLGLQALLIYELALKLRTHDPPAILYQMGHGKENKLDDQYTDYVLITYTNNKVNSFFIKNQRCLFDLDNASLNKRALEIASLFCFLLSVLLIN